MLTRRYLQLHVENAFYNSKNSFETMNKDNSASRFAQSEHIRAPPNSATAQLFRARRQHGQVGEVATLP